MCLHPCYTSNMDNDEYPCTDCSGRPGGCMYDEERQVCVAQPKAEPLAHGKRTILLLKQCEGLSVPAAYNRLTQFAGSNEVIWPLQDTPKGLKTEIRLKSFVKSDEMNWCMANNVHFKFWGGPPNKLGYYNGSLETMLKDRVLDFIFMYGIDEAIRVFAGGNRKQLCEV